MTGVSLQAETTPAGQADQGESLLAVENLGIHFRTRAGIVQALEQINFSIQPGETLAVVGESGSGKSVTALAIMGVLDGAAQIVSGSIRLQGQDLLAMPEAARRQIRGKEISMIFQNPRGSLNPIRQVGQQIEDILKAHTQIPKRELKERAIEMLSRVRIPDPARRYQAYPFELSGGMCQRVMIAVALACAPKLLIADEPTTGLDVTTQAAVMDLIRDLAHQNQMATLVITHDLALAADYCERIVVMHAGHVVEAASASVLFNAPRHPYTAKLIAATPEADKTLDRLQPIFGQLPDLRGSLPPCRFSGRCDRYAPDCDQVPLQRQQVGADHTVACWRPL